MKNIIYTLIVTFVVGISTFIYHSNSLMAETKTKSLKAERSYEPPRFEIIDFDFKIYTIRGHEYLGKDGMGLTHMADCHNCEIEKLNKQLRLKNLLDKAVTQ